MKIGKNMGALSTILMASALMANGTRTHGVVLREAPKTERNLIPCPKPDQRRYAKGMRHLELEFEHTKHGNTYSCYVHVSGGTDKAIYKEARRLNELLCEWINNNAHSAIEATGYFRVKPMA